ncbi:hypothetical protein MHK_008087 [Candidatus Magnetomorum sp. HK-1]|jgi:hypothetical protein|nr:hypothetical protein MHK_008087 [Candidatus Magnetomorum sp. HK-1]
MMQYLTQNIEDYVSVSPPIFKAAGNMAKKLGMNLTDFYTLALTSYMTKFNENITDTLDRIYEKEPSSIEPVIINAQSVSLGKESW